MCSQSLPQGPRHPRSRSQQVHSSLTDCLTAEVMVFCPRTRHARYPPSAMPPIVKPPSSPISVPTSKESHSPSVPVYERQRPISRGKRHVLLGGPPGGGALAESQIAKKTTLSLLHAVYWYMQKHLRHTSHPRPQTRISPPTSYCPPLVLV